MQADDIKALSDVRLGHALECLDTAQKVMELGDYKCAANRSYYAVFHAMRAVLVYDCIYAKKHSSIISEFRRLYIKTGVFDKEMSDTMSANDKSAKELVFDRLNETAKLSRFFLYFAP